MAHPLHHAESSARKFGGVPSDYQAVHDWFDASNAHSGLRGQPFQRYADSHSGVRGQSSRGMLSV